MVTLKSCVEIRVHGTPTSLILNKYGLTVQQTEVLDMVFQGQSVVIDNLVASSGNAPIQRLAFIFWSGNLYLRIQPERGGHMKWWMLAQAFQGIVQFMEEFGWMELGITVLDDKAGPVGIGELKYVTHRGLESNRSSLVETSPCLKTE